MIVMRTYAIYPIPYEIRGSEYLKLLYDSVKACPDVDAAFEVRRFSWKELLARSPRGERRLIHVHWETNIYGSRYIIVSLVRMAYRFPGLWMLKLRGVRIFWTIHNLTAHDYPHPLIDAFGRFLMWRLADAVQIQQKEFARSEKERRPGSNIVYIPHPNFVNVFGPVWRGDKSELRSRYGIGLEDKVLLAFGSVRPYKELPALIDAVSEARTSGAHVILLIAGKASKDYQEVITRKADGKSGISLHLGFVENEEVPALLGLADYSILFYSDSSLNSGPLLLSLSYGVPVITRDMPAAEIIEEGKNGFVFHNPGELRQILRKIDSVPIFDEGAIIKTSGPDWPSMAIELRRAYMRLWPVEDK